jgi:hypothetical protein
MAEAKRVARLVWPHTPAEREHILEQALAEVRANHPETPHPELMVAVCRLLVAVQLARLDEGSGHA